MNMQTKTLQPADSIMRPIKSTSIRAVGYVETISTLIIDFNGSTYVYDNVPLDLHDKFMQADSHGAFFQKHIRGKFDATRLPDPTPREAAAVNSLAG